MKAAEITHHFERTRIVDEPDFPRGEQLRMLSGLTRIYASEGLIRGVRAAPLWACCPQAPDCWKAAAAHRPPRRDDRSGISLPWIGPEYQRGGVAIIAINLRDAGGLLREYEITCESAGDGSQLSRLAAGFRTAHGSRLGYGSTRSAASVLDWLEGRPITDRTEPSELCGVLRRVTRLQAVKCSPADGGRSSPTPEMAHNCPELLLTRELELLRPGAVLTFGDAAWRAVYRMRDYTESPAAATDSHMACCAWASTQSRHSRSTTPCHGTDGTKVSTTWSTRSGAFTATRSSPTAAMGATGPGCARIPASSARGSTSTHSSSLRISRASQ